MAAFPVLAMWSANRVDVSFGDVDAVLALSIGVGIGLALLLGLAQRSLRRGAIAASALLAIGLLYGHVMDDPGNPIGLVVAGVLAAAGLWFALGAPLETIDRATVALNVVGAFLVLINLVPALQGQIQQSDAQLAAPVSPLADAPPDTPDVWYIVPDRFTSERALAEHLGIDGSTFVDALRERGFRVHDRAVANYATTLLSLASTLNMRYLDDIDDELGDDRVLAARSLLDQNQFARQMRASGREYIHIGSWPRLSATSSIADRTLTGPSNTFESLFVSKTIVPALHELITGKEDGIGFPPLERLNRQHGDHQLATLRALASERVDHPRFVFAHLILPHGPFVYRADGSLQDPKVNAAPYVEGYRPQLEFLQDQLLDLIDRILANPRPAYILIQADEGPLPEGHFDSDTTDWTSFDDADHYLHAAILSAVHIPDGGWPLDESAPTSAVNVMRALDTLISGTPHEPLPDRVLSFIEKDYHAYLDVTDRVLQP